MKTPLPALFTTMLATAAFAAPLPGNAPAPHPLPPLQYADAAPADEITRTGVLERHVAIGGETSGWVLRDEKEKKIELSLPKAAFATIREGMHVTVKGKLGTKKYLERGEVSIFHVREISEIVH